MDKRFTDFDISFSLDLKVDFILKKVALVWQIWVLTSIM
jgi:hypothetical protein